MRSFMTSPPSKRGRLWWCTFYKDFSLLKEGYYPVRAYAQQGSVLVFPLLEKQKN